MFSERRLISVIEAVSIVGDVSCEYEGVNWNDDGEPKLKLNLVWDSLEDAQELICGFTDKYRGVSIEYWLSNDKGEVNRAMLVQKVDSLCGEKDVLAFGVNRCRHNL